MSDNSMTWSFNCMSGYIIYHFTLFSNLVRGISEKEKQIDADMK